MNKTLTSPDIRDTSRKMSFAKEPAKAVEQAKASAGYAELENVNCGVESEKFILRGIVSNSHPKQLAQQAALRVVEPANFLHDIHVKIAR